MDRIDSITPYATQFLDLLSSSVTNFFGFLAFVIIVLVILPKKKRESVTENFTDIIKAFRGIKNN
jgi:hypothetical protein